MGSIGGPPNRSRNRTLPNTQRVSRQTDVPSQQMPQGMSSHVPFVPNVQPDIMQSKVDPVKTERDALPYVVTTFDARPLQTIDWTCFSGTNFGGAAFPDTLVSNSFGASQTVSLFYLVPTGRVAIIRDWSIDASPQYQAGDAGTAVVFADGSTNFWSRLDFLVDGVFAEQQSNIILGQVPFGSVAGEVYIIGAPGQLIEMRLTGLGADPAINNPNAQFIGAILGMHGNDMFDRGTQAQLQPGSIDNVPVMKAIG